jgi:hypothetical protein
LPREQYSGLRLDDWAAASDSDLSQSLSKLQGAAAATASEAKPVSMEAKGTGRSVDMTDGPSVPEWTTFLEGFSTSELGELLKINMANKVGCIIVYKVRF